MSDGGGWTVIQKHVRKLLITNFAHYTLKRLMYDGKISRIFAKKAHLLWEIQQSTDF